MWRIKNKLISENQHLSADFENCGGKDMLESLISAGTVKQLLGWERSRADAVAWSYDMAGHAKKCEERCKEEKIDHFYKVFTPCMEDHQVKDEELETVEELSNGLEMPVPSTHRQTRHFMVCTSADPSVGVWEQLHCFFLAGGVLEEGGGRRDRALNRRRQAGSRLEPGQELSSNGITHLTNAWPDEFRTFTSKPVTDNIVMWETISWMKRTAVSHSSTEAAIISLDAGVRLEGIPGLNFWDMVTDVSEPAAGSDPMHNIEPQRQHLSWRIRVYQTALTMFFQTHTSPAKERLFFFEDNDAVIKMIIKGPRRSMRHISRIRVNLDRLFDRINLDPGIQITCGNTSKQIADILTKGSSTRDRWTQLTNVHFDDTTYALMHISFGVFICTEVWEDVEASSTTYHRNRHSQTKAGA